MSYLYANVASLVLLAGFFALTRYETTRGARFFGAFRSRLDQDVERVEFILRNVDLAAFLREEVRHLLKRTGHDLTHFVLQVVRIVERLLTRAVRRLRMHEHTSARPTREASREFVRTLADFKGRLSSPQPEAPETPEL